MEKEASFLSRPRGASAEMMPTVFLFSFVVFAFVHQPGRKKGGRGHFVRLARQNVLNVDAMHMFKSLPVHPLRVEHLYVFSLSPSLCPALPALCRPGLFFVAGLLFRSSLSNLSINPLGTFVRANFSARFQAPEASARSFCAFKLMHLHF